MPTQKAMRSQKERQENVPQTGAGDMTSRLQSHQLARAAHDRASVSVHAYIMRTNEEHKQVQGRAKSPP